MALTPAYFETDNVTGQEIKLVGSGGPLVSNPVWLASRFAELAAIGFEFVDIPGETAAAYVEV